MAQPWAGSVTLSSAGVSPALMLDPTARITEVQLSMPGTVGVDATIQVTLDVEAPQLPSQIQFWDNLSTTHYTTAVNGIDGAMLQLQCPVAGLRLSSTAFTSGTLTLKVLQMIFG